MKKNFENYVFWGILVLVVILILIVMFLIYQNIKNGSNHRSNISEDGEFSVNFIKKSNEVIGHENYMISPYSVEVALSMVREGASGDTLKEIEKVVPTRKIKDLSIKKKVNIANGLFVKDIFKDDIHPNFQSVLKNNYQADLVYDSFNTPKKINTWVKKQTNGMIPKILDEMDPDFVLGLANAIAMEEEWDIPFDCNYTNSHEFQLLNGKKMNVSMMNHYYEDGVSYYSNDISQVVTIPYKQYSSDGKEVDEDGEQLEFVAILPDDVDFYIQQFSLDTIREIEQNKKTASDMLHVNVYLPRFHFDYNFEEFKDTLMDLGIQSMFNVGADLSNMIKGHDAYFSEAIHKSHIEVDEKGTKASAVTYFGVKDTAAVDEKVDEVTITFDKPFVFFIKDVGSNEILFFGVVYEPEQWNFAKTCE